MYIKVFARLMLAVALMSAVFLVRNPMGPTDDSSLASELEGKSTQEGGLVERRSPSANMVSDGEVREKGIRIAPEGIEIEVDMWKGQEQTVASKAIEHVWKNINDSNALTENMQKEGIYETLELGLYWQRDDIQRVFYPDVQEICEAAFGDYLSPLQGLAKMFARDSDEYKKRFRTDKQAALVKEGDFAMFYLFLPDSIAIVKIEDCGGAYTTTVKFLGENEAEGIRVLKIPPNGGMGIAGTWHKPNRQNYECHKIMTDGQKLEYTKADIQVAFSYPIQQLVGSVFGDYTEALQGLYVLAEQEGYGAYGFDVEDWGTYRLEGYYETTVIKENCCEFTMGLIGIDRARVTIKKEGEQYITTFRLLKEGEFETKPRAG